jgi:hypothetical protein
MTDRHDEPSLDDVMEPEEDIPPEHRPRIHGGMPRKPDDDDLEARVERDRVAAGVADYAPVDVPPAVDPPPEGTSERADLAERGLLEDEGDAADETGSGETGSAGS